MRKVVHTIVWHEFCSIPWRFSTGNILFHFSISQQHIDCANSMCEQEIQHAYKLHINSIYTYFGCRFVCWVCTHSTVHTHKVYFISHITCCAALPHTAQQTQKTQIFYLLFIKKYIFSYVYLAVRLNACIFVFCVSTFSKLALMASFFSLPLAVSSVKFVSYNVQSVYNLKKSALCELLLLLDLIAKISEEIHKCRQKSGTFEQSSGIFCMINKLFVSFV